MMAPHPLDFKTQIYCYLNCMAVAVWHLKLAKLRFYVIGITRTTKTYFRGKLYPN